MEMVERVKAAILLALAVHQEEYVRDFDKWTSLDGCFDLYAVSRAAIEAMRVPTNAMIDEGCKARDPRNSINDNTIATYVAMIDATLKTA